MTGPVWRKSAAHVKFAVKVRFAERAEILAKMAFFPLVLGVFSALWRAIGEGGMPLSVPPKQLVWYVAATEWVLLSSPQPALELERQVRRGDIGCQLTRPVSFLGAIFAQSLGTLLVQAPVFAVASVGSAWLFTGALPEHPLSLWWVVPFGLLAATVLLSFNMALGLCAFFFHSVSPLAWVWNKAAFTLGGLMLPLSLYPLQLQRAASFTPFPALLYGPARFVLETDHSFGLRLLLSQLGWPALAALLTRALFARAVAALSINGG